MTSKLCQQCTARQVLYYNRAARAAWVACTKPLYISSVSAMVAALQFFTGEYTQGIRFPRDRAVEFHGPQAASEFAVLSQDEDLGEDLRRLNGRPQDPAFDLFWSCAQRLLEEYKRVDDRRHGKRCLLLYMIWLWCF